MGKVQQRAGGGKVTTEGLAAENIRDGVTVTVRQGSKTVQSVTGGLKVKRIDIPSSNGNVDMKTLLPDAWQQLTIDNFAYSSCSASSKINNTASEMSGRTISASTTLKYDSTTGILTISGSTQGHYYPYAGHDWFVYSTRKVICYYCE